MRFLVSLWAIPKKYGITWPKTRTAGKRAGKMKEEGKKERKTKAIPPFLRL
jgi:hypothetical protein